MVVAEGLVREAAEGDLGAEADARLAALEEVDEGLDALVRAEGAEGAGELEGEVGVAVLGRAEGLVERAAGVLRAEAAEELGAAAAAEGLLALDAGDQGADGLVAGAAEDNLLGARGDDRLVGGEADVHGGADFLGGRGDGFLRVCRGGQSEKNERAAD